MTIPRFIHQIYLSGQPPGPLSANVAGIKAANPGWSHRLYDEEAALHFTKEHYGAEVLHLYRRIGPEYRAAKADLLRHLIIYQEGGVYLDIKSYAKHPLDEIVRQDDEYLLSQWTDNGPGQERAGYGLHPDLRHMKGGEYQMFHVIARPEHPFTDAAIKRILHNIKHYKPWNSVGRTGVLRTTGPIAYTLAIEPIRERHPHRIIDYKAAGLVPSIEYDHFAVFPDHYSHHLTPVVTLSEPGRIASAVYHRLRMRGRNLLGMG